jgi:hypothetical protein
MSEFRRRLMNENPNQPKIIKGYAIEGSGALVANPLYSTVIGIKTNGALRVTWGSLVRAGYLCEFNSEGKWIDYWGANDPYRTVSLTGKSETTELRVSFKTAMLDYSFVRDEDLSIYLWKGKKL